MPEQDAGEVFEEIRKGEDTKGSRARGRGLSARHLTPFFNPSNWSGFDDSTDVCILIKKIGSLLIVL